MRLNFHYTNNILERDTKSFSMKKGSTPNEFKKLIAPNGFLLPTICVIIRKGEKPIYLSDKLWDDLAECYFSEWDNIVKDDEDCYFISFHGEPATWVAVIALVIAVAVAAATYLLMPKPNLQQTQIDSGSSPTYDINGQGNRIRLGQAMPIHYGFMRFYPDVASSPYTLNGTISGERQRIFFTLLNCGYNRIDISDLRIDDTPLSTFPWATTNVRYPGDPATLLFPKPMLNSKEVSNVKVKNVLTDYYIINSSDSTQKTKRIYFDFSCKQGAYYSGGENRKAPVECMSSININLASMPASIDGFVMSVNDRVLIANQDVQEDNGIYVFNGVGVAATRALDALTAANFELASYEVLNGTVNAGPAGFVQRQYIHWDSASFVLGSSPLRFILYNTQSRIQPMEIGIWMDVQEIDSFGVNVGPIITIAESTHFGFTNTSLSTDTPTNRREVFFTTAILLATASRYKVRVRQGVFDTKTVTPLSFYGYTGATFDTNYNDEVEWNGLRYELDFPEPVHNDLTLIEIKIQASEKLNQSNIGIFNAFGKVRLTTYDFGTSTWLPASQTDSPIWAWYDMATNATYGCGLDPSAISLSNLQDIYNSIQPLGLSCNGRFDTSITGEDALEQISVSMRCKTYRSGGLFLLARDEEKLTVAGMFNNQNITEGTVDLEFKNKGSQNPQWIRITYYDDQTAKKETVDCVLPGVTPDANIKPDEIELRTITDRTKAWQEGMFYSAQNAYRREQMSFQTTMEGFIPVLFDKISITHNSINPSYQSGKVQKVIDAVVYLDEPVYFGGYATGFISFRKKDGSSLGPYICTHGVDQYSVNLIKFSLYAPDYTLFPFVSEFDQPFFDVTYFTFGIDSSSTLAIIKQIDAGTDNQATITCVNHDPRVHIVDKPIFLMPPIGTPEVYSTGAKYIPHTSLICDVNETQVPPVSGLGCTVNLATKLVTVKFNFSGYYGYRVSMIFNNLGVESIQNIIVTIATDGIKTATYTYIGNPPSRVTVIPTIQLTITPSITTEELLNLSVIVPILFV